MLEGTWSGRDDRTPAEELVRRYFTLPTEAAAALALACARALSDPDTQVRAGALYFFASVDDAVDGGALGEALLQHATLFQGVPDPYSPGQELFPLLLRVVAARVRAEDRELVSALKHAALIPGDAGWVLAALIDLDPFWVTSHATEIVHNNPDILKTLLWRMGRRHEKARVVAALLFRWRCASGSAACSRRERAQGRGTREGPGAV